MMVGNYPARLNPLFIECHFEKSGGMIHIYGQYQCLFEALVSMLAKQIAGFVRLAVLPSDQDIHYDEIVIPVSLFLECIQSIPHSLEHGGSVAVFGESRSL